MEDLWCGFKEEFKEKAGEWSPVDQGVIFKSIKINIPKTILELKTDKE